MKSESKRWLPVMKKGDPKSSNSISYSVLLEICLGVIPGNQCGAASAVSLNGLFHATVPVTLNLLLN